GPLERGLDRHVLERQIARRLVGHQHRDLVDELLEDLRRCFAVAKNTQLVLHQRVRHDAERRIAGGGVHGAQTTNFAPMTEYRPPGRANGWQLGWLLGLLMIGTWMVSLAAVLLWGRRDMARPASAIVVLGAAQYAGRPSPVLRARLDHAIDLWRRGLAPRIIFTGGIGDRDTTSESPVAQRSAREHGVRARRLMSENGGRPTSESLQGVASLMQAEPTREVILVSDPFHMLRLSILARRFGLTPYTSPTRTSPISQNRREEL